MNNVHISNRSKAMEWWNNIPNNRKDVMFNTESELTVKPFRDWKSLTGREIEIMYNLVHKEQSNNVL